MKAVIVTTQYVNNYGAVLQACGLHRFMKELGYEHEFLNQYSVDSKIYQKVLPIDCAFPYRLYQNLKKFLLSKQFKKKICRFDDFREKYLPQTCKFYNQDSIVNSDLKYDIYITGGDQMFNRSCLSRPANLLLFGIEDALRISYSTSVGNSKFTTEELKYLSKMLNRYNEISLREENSSSLLDGLIPNDKLRKDLDGALLLDSSIWKEYEQHYENVPDKYILVYELLPHKDVKKALAAVKGKYELPVVAITTNVDVSFPADCIVRDAGPAEFLWLFSNAEYVLTTSFHGTCFSIINQKPFFTLIGKREARINEMLDSYNLRNNYAYKFETLPTDIDFSTSVEKIKLGRKQAKEYLGRYFK